MSIKHFCDVCGEPATEMPWMPWVLKDKIYLQVGVFRSTNGGRLFGDANADVCLSCLTKAVRELADKLERECDG